MGRGGPPGAAPSRSYQPEKDADAAAELTTAGGGDLSPKTPALGRTLAALVMIIGYGVIAVPTGIVTVGIAQAARQKPVSTQACPDCSAQGHDADAVFCKYCSARL